MRKFFIIAIITVICISGFVGCEEGGKPSDNTIKGETIEYSIGYKDSGRFSAENHNLFQIVRTFEELEEISSEMYFFQTGEYGEDTKIYYLENLLSKYSAEYFEENALILYLYYSENSDDKTEVTSVTKTEDTVYVNLTQYAPEGVYIPSINVETLLIEVKLSDVPEGIKLEKTVKIEIKEV